MLKYLNCSVCKRDIDKIPSFAFKKNVYFGADVRMCGACYDAIPDHIPVEQVRRFIRRLVKGKE